MCQICLDSVADEIVLMAMEIISKGENNKMSIEEYEDILLSMIENTADLFETYECKKNEETNHEQLLQCI